MLRSLWGSIVSFIFVLSVTQAVVHAEISFGVNAPRGAHEALATWGELGKYLSAEVGQPVHIVPLKVSDLVAEVVLKDIRFVLAQPVQMVYLQDIFHATPLVSLNSPLGPRFAGVIIAKKGSGITHAESLKGKKVVGMSKTAAAGYMLQAYHLLKRGSGPCFELTADMKAVFAGYHHVQQNQIRTLGAGFVQCLLAVHSRENVVAFAREGVDYKSACRRTIIDHENFAHILFLCPMYTGRDQLLEGLGYMHKKAGIDRVPLLAHCGRAKGFDINGQTDVENTQDVFAEGMKRAG